MARVWIMATTMGVVMTAAGLTLKGAPPEAYTTRATPFLAAAIAASNIEIWQV